VKDAAYLYIHSKELLAINKKLHKLSGKAEKHLRKHGNAKNDKARAKHKKKHAGVTTDMMKLQKKQIKLLKLLQHHQIKFAYNLQKQKL